MRRLLYALTRRNNRWFTSQTRLHLLPSGTGHMRMQARPRDWPRTLASRRTTRPTKKRAEQSEPDVPGQDVAGSQQVSGTEVERVHHQLIAFIDGCVACLFDRTD